MKLFKIMKDGGKESTVTGYWLIECKPLFSVCLLRFDGKSREAFHTHAFNSLNWVLKGSVTEEFIDGKGRKHTPSFKPIYTKRTDFHKVSSDIGTTWVFSLRGPWSKRWKEYLPEQDRFITLTSGRKEVTNG
jgi:hypothetical protein